MSLALRPLIRLRSRYWREMAIHVSQRDVAIASTMSEGVLSCFRALAGQLCRLLSERDTASSSSSAPGGAEACRLTGRWHRRKWPDPPRSRRIAIGGVTGDDFAPSGLPPYVSRLLDGLDGRTANQVYFVLSPYPRTIAAWQALGTNAPTLRLIADLERVACDKPADTRQAPTMLLTVAVWQRWLKIGVLHDLLIRRLPYLGDMRASDDDVVLRRIGRGDASFFRNQDLCQFAVAAWLRERVATMPDAPTLSRRGEAFRLLGRALLDYQAVAYRVNNLNAIGDPIAHFTRLASLVASAGVSLLPASGCKSNVFAQRLPAPLWEDIAQAFSIGIRPGISDAIEACLIRGRHRTSIYVSPKLDERARERAIYHELAHFLFGHRGISALHLQDEGDIGEVDIVAKQECEAEFAAIALAAIDRARLATVRVDAAPIGSKSPASPLRRVMPLGCDQRRRYFCFGMAPVSMGSLEGSVRPPKRHLSPLKGLLCKSASIWTPSFGKAGVSSKS